jgi:osmoprotectant transport system substrate-binding protein
MKRGRAIFAALFAALVVASACGGAGTGGTTTRPDVIIGSTNFYEQLTLGELYAQILEANGYKVTRKFNLGNREIVQPAIESGQIDIDAEYLATLLAFVDKNGTIAKPTTDPKTTQTGLQKALDPKQLTVLDFAAATDQNGFVITKATADAKNIKSISDLQPYAGNWVLGGPPECPQRPFCQLGLKTVYGLEFKDFKPLDAGGPLTVAALEGKQIDVGLLFTSDPSIVAKNFVLLEDNKHLQLADNIAPVVRNALLQKDDGTLKRLLNSISAKLSQGELNAMNKQVAVDKQDNKTVAAAWLKKQGLIK